MPKSTLHIKLDSRIPLTDHDFNMVTQDLIRVFDKYNIDIKGLKLVWE
jgi:hypothetical protein